MAEKMSLDKPDNITDLNEVLAQCDGVALSNSWCQEITDRWHANQTLL